MHDIVYLVFVECPSCHGRTAAFVGNNEDGSFYCTNMVEVQGGKAQCAYAADKIWHMDVTKVARISLPTIGEEKVIEVRIEKGAGVNIRHVGIGGL